VQPVPFYDRKTDMVTKFDNTTECGEVKTMPDVVCFCGCYYRFEGDIGVCPRCAEYVSVNTVSPEERRQMQAELALVLAANEPAVGVEGSAERRSDLGY
jgi:hypothetical protein